MSSFPTRTRITLWVLAAAVFAATFANMMVPGVLPVFSAETGISMADVGRSNAVFGIAYAVAAPVVAAFVRKRSPFMVLLIALPLSAVAVAGIAMAGTSMQLNLVRVGQAMTVAGVVPMCTVHAGSIVAPRRRSKALSISFGGMVLSSLLGAPAGNLLAGAVGARASFLWCALLLLVVAAAASGVVRWQADLAQPTATTPVSITNGLSPASMVVLGAVFVTALLEGAATSGLNTFVSPFLTETVGATDTTLSLLLLCYGIAGLAGNALLGAVADRLGPARVLVAVTVAAAVAVAGLMVAGTPVAAAAFLLGWGFCSWAINPPLQALIMAHSGRYLRLLVAVNSSVIFTGSSLGAGIASAQVDAGGLADLPLTSAVIFLLAAVGAAVAWGASGRAHGGGRTS